MARLPDDWVTEEGLLPYETSLAKHQNTRGIDIAAKTHTGHIEHGSETPCIGQHPAH